VLAVEHTPRRVEINHLDAIAYRPAARSSAGTSILAITIFESRRTLGSCARTVICRVGARAATESSFSGLWIGIGTLGSKRVRKCESGSWKHAGNCIACYPRALLGPHEAVLLFDVSPCMNRY